MGEDLSTGAKIGIILIILCSLIAIVFSLLTMMKNITNSGASQLQGSLDQMLLSQFDDYDQKTVTGTQVKASIKVFSGQDIAIVIRPGLAAKEGKFPSGFNYGALLQGYSTEKTGNALKGYGNVYTSGQSVGIDGSCMADKYNGDVSNGLTLHKSGTYYVGGLLVPDGEILVARNDNPRPLDASGKESFVRTSAKYRAMLIKDEADAIIGIVFDELTSASASDAATNG